MDVGYPEKGLQDLSDLQMEDGSTLVEELDLNFVVNKEENAKDNINEDLARSNNLNEQGSSPLADFRYNEISGTRSPIQTEFDHNDVTSATKSVYDQERSQSPSKDNHYQAEREEFFGSYLYKSSSQVKEETLHNVIETEVSAHSGEFFSVEDASQGEAIGDGQTSPAHDELEKETFSETSQYELTSPEPAYKQVEEEVSNLPTEQLYSSLRLRFSDNETKGKNIYYSTNSPTESRKLDMPHSDWHSPERSLEQSKSTATVGQMSVSHETSPCKHQSPSSQKPVASQQGLQELSYSSRSHGKKRSSSPRKSDLGKNVRSGRQDSASPRGSLRGSQHMDGSSKHVSSSPRKHYSPHNHRRRDRSVSRSPIRQRDSSSGYKRDYRNRSRSRSPNTRDHYRRSPRRRYSPRRRSPPSSYHSYQRSPKRRPWSPPPNRSTGIGKPGRNLFVAGFSFLTTERDLERKFARFGHVRDVRIVRDKRSGDSRGFGFLTLERDEQADAAIRALDKTEWNGRIVLVEKSKSH